MNKLRKNRGPDIVTIIGYGTEIGGGIVFSSGLHVDGVIRGDVQATGSSGTLLTMSQGGRIEGAVFAESVRIDGEIVGDIHVSQRVELGPHARVEGDVYYRWLEMAMGAQVNGSLNRLE